MANSNKMIEMNENDYDARELLEPLYEEAALVKQRVLFPVDQAQEVIDQIIQTCESEGKRFYDYFFPPNKRSYSHYPPSYLDESEFDDFTWKRFSDLHSDPELFVKKIQPRDINQSGIGNCYMIAEIASLAQHPELIQEAFYPNEWNSAGVFGVKIWIETIQEWRMVILDDFFPVDEYDDLLFARSKTKNEAWSSLLEKAIAKINGSYQTLQAGRNLIEVLPALTGQPMYLFEPKSIDEAFEGIQYYCSNGGLVQSGGGTFLEDGSYAIAKKEEGLVQAHAYSVLNAVEMDGFRLIKLRNPWGHFEWNGDWSDESDLWNEYPEIAEACKHKKSDNGIFWMSIEDFYKRMEIPKVIAFGFDHLPNVLKIGADWALDTMYFEFRHDLEEVTEIRFKQIDDPDSDEKILNSLPQYKLELSEWTEFMGVAQVLVKEAACNSTAYIFPNGSGERISDISLFTNKEYVAEIKVDFSTFELEAGTYTIVLFSRNHSGTEGIFHLWTKDKLDLVEI